MEELETEQYLNKLKSLEKLIDNLAEKFADDTSYTHFAGKSELETDMQQLMDALDTLNKLDKMFVTKPRIRSEKVQKKRSVLQQEILNALIYCKQLAEKLFSDEEIEQSMEQLLKRLNHNFGHNATSNPYLVDFK